MNVMIAILIIIAILLAELSQNNAIYDIQTQKTYCEYKNFFAVPYALSFCVLAGICFFCKSGTDMPVYVELYSSFTTSDFSNLKFEIGDKILFVFLHKFIKNPYVGIGIVKILSIGLVYRSIYLVRNKIKIGLAVTSYITLLYVFNFHLIRMMLAIGLVFFALSYEIIGKRLKCIILLAAAICFHYSSCIVLLIYIVYLIFLNNFSVIKILIMLLGMTFVYGNAIQIISALTQIDIFSKYTTYEVVNATGSGMVQLVLFIPVMLILIKSYPKEKHDSFYQVAFFCGIMTFFTGSMGYVYSVIGRLTYYFYFFFVIYGAATPLKKNDIGIIFGKYKVNMSTLLIHMFLIMNMYIYFIVGNAFKTNGLLQYTTIFN